MGERLSEESLTKVATTLANNPWVLQDIQQGYLLPTQKRSKNQRFATIKGPKFQKFMRPLLFSDKIITQKIIR
jgi:hypothetical protein